MGCWESWLHHQPTRLSAKILQLSKGVYHWHWSSYQWEKMFIRNIGANLSFINIQQLPKPKGWTLIQSKTNHVFKRSEDSRRGVMNFYLFMTHMDMYGVIQLVPCILYGMWYVFRHCHPSNLTPRVDTWVWRARPVHAQVGSRIWRAHALHTCWVGYWVVPGYYSATRRPCSGQALDNTWLPDRILPRCLVAG